jgi:hypothetical protein
VIKGLKNVELADERKDVKLGKIVMPLDAT